MSENQLRDEIDAIERPAARTVELGARAVVISVAVFVLIVGQVLPWMGDAAGWQVLLAQGDAAGKAGAVPRLFAGTSILFGILTSALALTTRRWALTWVAALGGWFASVDGVLAIWTRQSAGNTGGPGIGMVISEVAMVVLAVLWFRTAWSRD
ncbi:putative conserved transmembrane protein [Actinokineospora spheciospongiae]|uniref:Putative conserved transmembrane protein n=1 Tax=Actinokineospora spheciospongiae TaxID=909613 RepID=W7IW92_9PSEU|nr:hypothetical protein [Actinokineospora spheciospongiae]EWC58284.1 putative conserved transmembrane protein [Actinokineospora spheciospongiae]PWW58455.1 hypothetical protein DFQ13_109248 [Actinokineospora spheciospongiae]